MKRIENRKTEITESRNVTEENPTGDIVNLGFLDLLLTGLNSPPKEGFTTSEMKERFNPIFSGGHGYIERFNVISKIEDVKVGDTVELEDAEFLVAYNCRIKNWRMMHRDIVAFDEHLEEVKKQK